MSVDLGKAKKILSNAFCDNVNNISEDEAATLIVKAEQQIKLLKDEEANDEKLNAAKSIVKDLGRGYKDAMRYEEAKIQYLLAKIQEIQDGEVNPNASA